MLQNWVSGNTITIIIKVLYSAPTAMDVGAPTREKLGLNLRNNRNNSKIADEIHSTGNSYSEVCAIIINFKKS